MPIRIQRKRTKGWKMPEGAVYVGRPGWFGNPFRVDDYWRLGFSGSERVAAEWAVEAYRLWLTQQPHRQTGVQAHSIQRLPYLPLIRGNDLACWCALDYPCHADVLLELANNQDRP